MSRLSWISHAIQKFDTSAARDSKNWMASSQHPFCKPLKIHENEIAREHATLSANQNASIWIRQSRKKGMPKWVCIDTKYCWNLKVIKYGSTNLNRIVADKSHRVIIALRRISCHGRNYSQPYFFKRNQSSDNRSHGFGAKFLLKKLSASDFSYEWKSAFTLWMTEAIIRAELWQ